MGTDPLPARATGGFTLLEVMVAMIILAVGLLGLQALTVSAVRAVGFGQHQSEYATFASSLVEERIQAVRGCDVPPDDDGEAPRGNRYEVVVTPAGPATRRDVAARITNGEQTLFELSTSVFVGHCTTTAEEDVE